MSGRGITTRADLARQYTHLEFAAGEALLARFAPNIHEELQAAAVLSTLIEERVAAANAIDAKHAALAGRPGAPRGPVLIGRGKGLGFVREYDHGAIFWRRDLGAYWVHGDIYAKYRDLGGEAGFLGYPRTDEVGTGDGDGWYNDFEGGSIYWHMAIGAREVHGAIRDKWLALGAVAFGYPTTDEQPAGQGRLNHFRAFRPDGTTPEATIVWMRGGNAVEVHGAIRQRWGELGWSESYLGNPVTDEGGWVDPEKGDPGRVSHFERGALGWTPEDGVSEWPERIVMRSGPIGVSSIGGWVELIVSSVGTFVFRGHLHNSGFVQLACTVGCGIKINGSEAVYAKKEVNVGGTVAFDSRDEDWEDSGYSWQIRQNWDFLRENWSLTTVLRADFGPESFFLLVFLPLVGAAYAATLIFGGKPPEYQNCKVGDMHVVKDGNNNTIAEPQGIRCTN